MSSYVDHWISRTEVTAQVSEDPSYVSAETFCWLLADVIVSQEGMPKGYQGRHASTDES